MKLSHVRFLATDGYKLAGLLYEPKGECRRAAIYLHGNGYGSIFESVEKMNTFGSAFIKNNIAFLAFNNRGSNMVRKLKREVMGQEEETKGGTAYELIADCSKDIDGAIEYLQNLGYRELYLIGESTGANKICVYNYHKPRHKLQKVVLLSGGDDTGIYYDMLGKNEFFRLLAKAKEMIEAGKGTEIMPDGNFGLSYQSFYDTCNPDGDYNIFPYNEYFNHLHLAHKKIFREYEALKMPVLVMYGSNDEYCYGMVPQILELLEEKSQSVHFKAVIVPGGDHGLTGKLEEGAALIAEWLVLA